MNTIKFAALTTALVAMVGCSGSAQKDEETTTVKPVVQEPVQEPVDEPQQRADSQYQVERGDNLWGISGRAEIYGNPYQWPLIYKNNTARIKDADLIYPGQIFDINVDPSAGEVNAAINHAKTRGRWSLGTVEASDKAYLNN